MSDRTLGKGPDLPDPSDTETNSVAISDYDSVTYLNLMNSSVNEYTQENSSEVTVDDVNYFDPEFPTPAQSDFHQYAALTKEVKRRGSATSTVSDESRSPLPQKRKPNEVDERRDDGTTGGAIEHDQQIINASTGDPDNPGGAGALRGENPSLWSSSLPSPLPIQPNDYQLDTVVPNSPPVDDGEYHYNQSYSNFITPPSPLHSITGLLNKDQTYETDAHKLPNQTQDRVAVEFLNSIPSTVLDSNHNPSIPIISEQNHNIIPHAQPSQPVTTTQTPLTQNIQPQQATQVPSSMPPLESPYETPNFIARMEEMTINLETKDDSRPFSNPAKLNKAFNEFMFRNYVVYV